MTRAEDVRRRITTALIYPAFVLGSSFMMVGLLVVFMLPHFASMFTSQGAELPWLTRVVLAFFGCGPVPLAQP